MGVNKNRRPEEEMVQCESNATQGEQNKLQGRGKGINNNWNSSSEGQTFKVILTGLEEY